MKLETDCVLGKFILHEAEMELKMNTEKFTGRALAYEKYRPSYPMEFIDYLYTHAGFKQESIIADIGSGTGILSSQLLERGNRVIGVEPNEDMRRTAEKNLTGYSNFHSVAGADENTTLSDGSIDFITVAQAFHWFDIEGFKKECRRILKPEGKVVLVWNSRVADSKIVMENAEICQRLCPAFKGFSGGEKNDTGAFMSFFRDGIFENINFENNMEYNPDNFIGRNLSASYAPKPGEDNFNLFVSELTELYEKYEKDGKVVLPNITRCYIGRV